MAALPAERRKACEAGEACGRARLSRAVENAGRLVRLEVPGDYRPPVPTAEDVLFSPEAPPCTREEVRLLDSTAIQEYHVPGVVLMENAGWRVAREAYAMLGFDRAADGRKVLVLAGPGNNGGDGFVASRHLAGWGVAVEVVLLAPREKVSMGGGDAAANLKMAEEAGVDIRGAGLPEAVDGLLPEAVSASSLVIDAVLGTGVSGNVRGAAARAIEILNESDARVLAVDTPSGLDANTGEVLGVATSAERTVTFAFAKKGFFVAGGPSRAGEIVVADLSIPRALWSRGR